MEPLPWNNYAFFPEVCIVWDGERWTQQLTMKMECMPASPLEDEVVKLYLSGGPMYTQYVWVNGQELREERSVKDLCSWFSDKMLVSFVLQNEGPEFRLTGLLKGQGRYVVSLYESEQEARETTRRS